MPASGDRLGTYRAKRGAPTPEPGGEAPRRRRTPKAKAPRFVVQQHSARRLHWDLRLERDGVLVSFALPNGLPYEPGHNLLAVHTEDHPLEYLEFHGEIPKGSYGAGTMDVWDTGTYEVRKFDEEKIEVRLQGERVDGWYALFPLKGDRGSDDWMIHRMGDAAEAAPPERIAPMLATLGRALPTGDGWAYEFKWDGVRAICHAEPGRMRLHTRNLNDVTARYPELGELTRAVGHRRIVLDGEVVAFDADGRPSFGALQGRMHLSDAAKVKRAAGRAPVSYVLFDVLWADGASLLEEPYERRRAVLEGLGLESDRVRISPSVVGHGDAVLATAREQGLEGVIAKRLDCPYQPGRRSPGWVKVKLVGREDFLIGGWVPGTGRREDRIGALLLGERDEDGALRHVGRVGTGFTQDELDRVAARLAPLRRAGSPFDAGPPAPKIPRNAVFVEPAVSCEIEFLERSSGGALRAPSYKGLRDDTAPAATVVRTTRDAEIVEVEGHEVRLSNPDKVLYAATGFTKRDLLAYYLAIAPVLLAHLGDRRLTLKRYPNGAQGEFFFEKRAPSHRPDWVPTSGGYVVAEGPAVLAWLANLADLELHTPLARAVAPERPDLVAFDLDPGEGAGLPECATVAQWLRAMLDGLGLQAFPKTSGSKGMQVYVPLNDPDATWPQTKAFARMLAELLAREAPELVVATQAKAKRAGKILVDWSQNDEHKTTVCVYSPRARERPTVSTPLTWEEVAGDAASLVFTTDDVLARVARDGDLFAPVATLRQTLPS
jgi:bifunctional non-homologous end joining protein LigD